jgi:hypothetical protein
MRVRLRPIQPRSARPCVRRAAFTLSEVMVATGILLIVFGGNVASHLFGMRIMEKTNARAGASTEARENIRTLMAEVCSAKNIAVGTGGQSAFTEFGMNVLQKGSALQIYPTTSTNVFVRYYLDSSAKTLNRMTNGASGLVVATGIKNTDLFAAEDVLGNVVTNNQNNSVIGLNLQFQYLQYTNMSVSSNSFYTSYQVRTKLARRSF